MVLEQFSSLEIIALIGFLLSLYALKVERDAEKKQKKAICDVNDKVSCSKAFTSEWGRIAYLPNSFYGIIFYFIVFILAYLGLTNYVFYLAVISVLGSIYLAYILYTKIKSFCLVCTSIYVVNILLLVISYLKI